MSEPEFIRHHRHPRPLLRRLARTNAVVGLTLIAVGVVAQALLAALVAPMLPLLLGTMLFSLILAIPLLLQTVLHPEVSVTSTGLALRPLLWSPQRIAWAHLREVVAHPLIYEDVLTQRRLFGSKYRPRRGQVIVLSADAPTHWLYRLVGGLSGCGLTPAFAISSTTHSDYEALLEVVVVHLAADQPEATDEAGNG